MARTSSCTCRPACASRPASPTCWRRTGVADSGRPPLGDLDPVEDVPHAGDAGGEVLARRARPPVAHAAFQRDVRVADLHGDLAGVDARIVGQPLAHVLEDALIGPAIVTRAAAGVGARTEGDVPTARRRADVVAEALARVAGASLPFALAVALVAVVSTLDRLHRRGDPAARVPSSVVALALQPGGAWP